ncbi:MAG: hypothetical protein MHM6MM_005314 [Cercozoa sp. M6MM]
MSQTPSLPSGKGLVKQLLPVAIMIVLRKSGIADQPVEYLRVVFGVFVALQLAVYGLMYLRIKSKADNRPVRVRAQELSATASPEEVVNVPTHAYDQAMLMKSLQQLAIQTGIVLLLHLKWEYVQPLFFAGLMGLYRLSQQPLFSLYVLNKEEDRSLRRPFAKSGLEGWMDKLQQQAAGADTPMDEQEVQIDNRQARRRRARHAKKQSRKAD